MPHDAPYLAVATLAPEDATTTLFFTHVADRVPLRIVPFSVEDMTGPVAGLGVARQAMSAVAGARAIIFTRGLFEFDGMIRSAAWAGLPRYYFADDNFIILKNEPGLYHPSLARRYSPDGVRKALKTFSGVLLSTPSLVDYFAQNNLHPRLFLYPPVADTPETPRVDRQDATTRIAFFGGMHRREPFRRAVYPAVVRLAAERPVELFAAGIDVSGLAAAGLTVTPVPYRSSYPAALVEMAARRIDILVHPSNATANNVYKNPHFIINARALGAAPIFSDAPPYNALANEGVALLCDDSAESWYRALCRLAADDRLRQQMKTRIAAYCDAHFNGAANVEMLKGILGTSRAPRWPAAARIVPLATGLAGAVVEEFGVRQLKRIGRWQRAVLARVSSAR